MDYYGILGRGISPGSYEGWQLRRGKQSFLLFKLNKEYNHNSRIILLTSPILKSVSSNSGNSSLQLLSSLNCLDSKKLYLRNKVFCFIHLF